MGQEDEQAVSLDKVQEIAEKLRDTRRVYVSLWGLEKLKEQVESHRPLLEEVCHKHGCTIIEAMIKVLNLEGITREQAMVTIAVVTEIIDPHPAQPEIPVFDAVQVVETCEQSVERAQEP